MSKTAEKIINIVEEIDGSFEEKLDGQAIANLIINRAPIIEQEKDECEKLLESSEPDKIDMNRLWSYDYYQPVISNKKGFGILIVFIKKVIRRILRFLILPIVTHQNNFNASVTRTVNSLYSSLQTYVKRNHNDITNLKHSVEDSNNLIIVNDTQNRIELESLKEQIANLKTELNNYQNIDSEIRNINKQIFEFRDLLNIQFSDKINNEYSIIDYAEFEDRFRGTSSVIKDHQKDYVKYFKKCKNVIDIGCGRGEFLELMKECGIQAVGIDQYGAFIDICQKKGLNVIQKDGIEYLSKEESNSIDGIFSAQVVEHISSSSLIELCVESYRVLKKSGCLIIETPNPMCLSTFTNSFYLDPTHNNPIHPKYLSYILEKAGFTKIELIFPEKSRVNYRLPLLSMNCSGNLAEFNDGVNLLSEVIFGSQDYAIVAIKV